MINSSADFNTAVQATSRHFDAKIYKKANNQFQEVECDIMKIRATKGACGGETFSVGSVFSSSIEVEVCNLATALDNSDIKLEIGVLKANDTYEYIEYGHYTVIKAPKTTKQATLTAVGFIASKLIAPISLNSNSPTITQIATAITTASGVNITLPTNTGSFALTKSVDGLPARSALELIASVLGCYATETNTGSIVVKRFEIPNSKVAVTGDRCLAEPTMEDDFNMTGVKVIVPEEADDEGETTPAAEYLYPTGGVARQTYENKYMTQTIFESQYGFRNIVGYTFTPATVDMTLGDPRIEPWDCLSVTDENSNTFNVPCHSIESTFDGGFSSNIKSTGESESEPAAEGTLTKQFSVLTGQMASTEIAAARAEAAANAAEDILDDMESAAEAAGTTLTQIYQDAAEAGTSAREAKTDAAEAKTQAINATNYANGALTQLGTVESVVDTLNWIAEHSTFVLSADASVVSGKTYYIPSNNTLTITADTQTVNGVTFTIDKALGTVTMNGTATESTFVNLGSPAITASDDAYLSGVTGGSITTYALRYAQAGSGQFVYDGAIKLRYYASYNDVWAYVRSGATVNNVVLTPRVTIGGGDYEYQIVENPTGNPSTEGYYELNTSDAVKTYVQSHLSLANEGLYVLKDGSGWKVLIKNTGVEIQNASGNSVAEYGASVRIGLNANGSSRTEISDSGMSIIHRAGDFDSMLAKFGYGPTINEADQTVNDAYFSLGADRNARGQLSISAGIMSRADGAGSIATGYESTADGHYSATFGRQTYSSGACSFSIGEYSHATGICAFAGGNWARVNGTNAFGFGNTVKANYDNQAAFGKYNDNKSGDLFEIGNGSSSSALSNAFEVDTSGNVNIPSGAKYKINGTNLAASDVGAVPTSRTVNSKALSSNITLTASDVSALATSDKYTRSSAGGLDWTNNTEGDTKVIMKSALAFWNGSYNGITSNLSRCTQGQIIGRNQICYANSRVDTFSSGKITIANTSLGVTTGAKPVGILLTPEYGGAVMMKYNYDSSTNTNSIIECYNADGSAYNGAMRYFAVVFQNTWTSV